MKTSYLVQRGTFAKKNKEDIQGIDSLINFNYMGSAEFEFGALPRSLNRIIGNWSKYGLHETKLKDKQGTKIWVLCHSGSVEDSVQNLNDVANRKYRLKEYASLDRYLKGEESPDDYSYTNFWWDIENDWMACPGIEKAELLKYAIEKVIKKRKDTV